MFLIENYNSFKKKVNKMGTDMMGGDIPLQ